MVESKAAFARRKGWNRSTATRYAEAGKLVVTADGQVNVEASEALLASIKDPLKEGVRQRHERERPASRRGKGGGDRGDGDLRVDPNDTSYQVLTKHRAAAEYNRSELLRMELEAKQGSLVDAEAVRKRAFQVASTAGEAVMNLRFRIDPLLAGEIDPVKRAEIWDRELRLIREEIARSIAAPLTVARDGG